MRGAVREPVIFGSPCEIAATVALLTAVFRRVFKAKDAALGGDSPRRCTARCHCSSRAEVPACSSSMASWKAGPMGSAPQWCRVVHISRNYEQVSHMAAISKRSVRGKEDKEGTRASVTFPGDLYAELERIAGEKKVSVAWVVRDAVEKYVEAQYPLFQRRS